MAVGDSTGGFQHTENNTGSQIQSASSNIAGTIGEARQVQMPEAPHTATWAEGAAGVGNAIESGINGFTGALSDGWDTFTSWGSDTINGMSDSIRDNLFGQVGGSDGVFVGMNTDSIDTFKSDLKVYIDGAQEILDGLNLDPAMEVTLKGSAIEESFHEFLDAIKTLLSAYVQSLHALDKEIQEAADNYQSAQQKIGSDVSSDAGEIRSQAGSIEVA